MLQELYSDNKYLHSRRSSFWRVRAYRLSRSQAPELGKPQVNEVSVQRAEENAEAVVKYEEQSLW